MVTARPYRPAAADRPRQAGQPGDEHLHEEAEVGSEEQAGRPGETPAPGGGGTRGPSVNQGGTQEPGGLVPPYDDRQKTGTVDEDSAVVRDGADVGGAGQVRATRDEMTSADPSETPGGRVTTPVDEQPATGDESGGNPDPGVGPAHTTGTPRGEDGGT